MKRDTKGEGYLTAKELQGQEYVPMCHGKATDALSALHAGDPEEDKFSGDTTVKVNGVAVKMQRRNDASGIYYVGMHKLLSVAIILFCSQSHTNADCCEVVIPLRDYAILCGCNIRENGAKSEAEKKRERNVIKDVRKKVDRDLDVLFALELSWSEKKWVRGKGRGRDNTVSYMDMHLISKKGIIDGNVVIDFTPDFAKYLTSIPITQYPLALLKIDERNRNAYSMGLQMAEHANMPSNIKVKTATLLKVGTLLKYTNLPGRDSRSVKKVGWRERIKAPFEKSLDALTKCGLLQNWEYTHSKGVPLTDEEADFKTFEEWSEMLVHFILMDQVDCTYQPGHEDEKCPEEQPEWDIDTSDLGDVAVGDWGMLL